ncbi:MAG: hypothetical protein JSU05_15575 [Bacteroidetes bacterium]|nr:hypothetical protein [Bacteroidota bacterium]
MRPFFILLTLITSQVLFGQTLKKYSIGNTGCSVYFTCNPGEFQQSYSEDSSAVYTAECISDSLHYGLICVQLKEKVSSGDDAENLLTSYLDYLKSTLEIQKSAGYGKGATLAGSPQARGVVDYWEDKEGAQWKIKGWTDGAIIAVLYVYADGPFNETEKTNVFLNGFRFATK